MGDDRSQEGIGFDGQSSRDQKNGVSQIQGADNRDGEGFWENRSS
jgi:hypothetical protein